MDKLLSCQKLVEPGQLLLLSCRKMVEPGKIRIFWSISDIYKNQNLVRVIPIIFSMRLHYPRDLYLLNYIELGLSFDNVVSKPLLFGNHPNYKTIQIFYLLIVTIGSASKCKYKENRKLVYEGPVYNQQRTFQLFQSSFNFTGEI